MDFELNDEQRLFRQTLREFVDKEIMPVASEWERTGRYPTEIVERFKHLGLFGITIPEEYGGLARTGCRSPWSSRRSHAGGWAWPECSAHTPWPRG